MIKSIVSRDDTLSQSMPDLAPTANGALVCAFRESALYPQQGAFETPEGPLKSRISVRVSRDQGGTWGGLIPVGGVRMGEGFLNCPRLCRLQDGTLLLAVDWVPPSDQGERNPACRIRGYRVARGDWTLSPAPARGERGRMEETEPYTKRMPFPETEGAGGTSLPAPEA